MSSPIFDEKFRNPAVGFNEVLKKGAGGAYRERGEYCPFMFRALVIAVDTHGGRLETPTGAPEGAQLVERVVAPGGKLVATYRITPTRGPRNPKNSIRARILSSNMDQFIDDDNLRTFWPLFATSENPSPGELAYVVFEDEQMTHGLWIGKVPNSSDEDNANQMLMGQYLRDVKAGKKNLFDDSRQPAVTRAPDGSPVKDPQRLTRLFLGEE